MAARCGRRNKSSGMAGQSPDQGGTASECRSRQVTRACKARRIKMICNADTILKRITHFFVLIALLLAPVLADARITQFIITSTQSPTFEGISFGTVGRYEKLIGRITGE